MKGAVRGVMRGSRELGADVTKALPVSAAAAVKTAGELGADVADAARSAVEDARQGADEHAWIRSRWPPPSPAPSGAPRCSAPRPWARSGER